MTTTSDWTLSTSVAMGIFNRPEATARVFAEVRRARPPRLFVFADGPRPDRPSESALCAEAREVVEQVDWPCDVATEYAEQNLGTRARFSSGLDWVFESAEEAIVLEDDCLPHPTFFRFCEEILSRYRDDERVMHVSGDNFSMVNARGIRARVSRSVQGRLGPSYYFSGYPHVWGWGSWRRAWQRYEGAMDSWSDPNTRGNVIASFADPAERSFWEHTWDALAKGEDDSWAYQWVLACIANDGLSVMPRRNLVSNLGFGPGAVHTTNTDDLFAELPLEGARFPLRHPRSIVRDASADAQVAHQQFGRSRPRP
jgi:hypothetical protein